MGSVCQQMKHQEKLRAASKRGQLTPISGPKLVFPPLPLFEISCVPREGVFIVFSLPQWALFSMPKY